MTTTILNTYALICHTFGRKFSFNAQNKQEAERMMRCYAKYHGQSSSEYHVHTVPNDDNADLHNEYMDSL